MVLSEICWFQFPLLLSALSHTIELLSFAGPVNLKGIAHSAWDINASLSRPSKPFFCAKCIAEALGNSSIALVTLNTEFNGDSFVSAPLWGEKPFGEL